MEDAFTLIVLTLLQLCRAEISKPVPEWYAANLINDSSFTPKPITEIFTTDLSFTSIDQFSPTQPTVFPTPAPATTSPTSAPTTIIRNEETTMQEIPLNAPFEVVQLSQPQRPVVFSQTANRPSNSDPRFVIIFDPRQGGSFPPSVTSTTTEDNRSIVRQSPIQVPEMVAQETTITPNIPIPVFRPLDINQVPIAYLRPFSNNTGSGIPSTPITDLPPAVPASPKPMITVRVKSNRGTVTNILINPSTTRKPLTTKRRKTNQRRNNYEICLNSCSERREPICASPAGEFPINPDKLKGFPSLCHMACNNSFRKNQIYDKVTDGRCGKLRTRIRPIDKNKLNREELNKAQYTILHNGPETVMEFSPLSP